MSLFLRSPLSVLLHACFLLMPLTAAADSMEDKIQSEKAPVKQLLNQISAQRISAYIDKLVGFHTRHTMSETESETRGIGAARRWIKAELERCGAGRLDVRFDAFVQPVSPRISRPVEIVNVVATLKSRQPSAPVYVVSGHYDSRATDVMDASSFAPGANDDASGTAAVMEMACVMSKYDFHADIVFMAVAAEEQGLYGATHWAQQAKEQQLPIAGMFTNDIIGSSRSDTGQIDRHSVRVFAEGIPSQKELSEQNRSLIATGGENDSISRQLARHVKEAGERYVPGFTVNVIQRRDRYLRGGDHIPFLERGYAALRFTEPNEDFSHQHQDVRTEKGVKIGDLPEFVDAAYTADVARINAAALATLAMAPAAPTGVTMHTARLENDTTISWNLAQDNHLAGYRIVWRATDQSQWQGSIYVGKTSGYTVQGKSKDNYFFGVQAVSEDGYTSVASYPLPARK